MSTTQTVTVTVRLRRAKFKKAFHATVVGGAYEGNELIMFPEPEQFRRWVAVAKYEAMITVPVAMERLDVYLKQASTVTEWSAEGEQWKR